MCSKCGDFNYQKRTQSADLDGKVALVTGGQIKIGYEIVLKLLRCGAKYVIVTTRFPVDALKRFQSEDDFSSWESRLFIYQLDLRFLPRVEAFCDQIQRKFGQLDILIQNAAQTIRKPSAFYKNLAEAESNLFKAGTYPQCSIQNVTDDDSRSLEIMNFPPFGTCALENEDGLQIHSSQILTHSEDFKYSQNPILAQQHFPTGQTDIDGNLLDLRPRNSWVMRLDEVETPEMVEVSLVNYMAPYLFCKN